MIEFADDTLFFAVILTILWLATKLDKGEEKQK